MQKALNRKEMLPFDDTHTNMSMGFLLTNQFKTRDVDVDVKITKNNLGFIFSLLKNNLVFYCQNEIYLKCISLSGTVQYHIFI